MDSLLIYVILGFLYKIAENLKGLLCIFAEYLKEKTVYMPKISKQAIRL